MAVPKAKHAFGSEANIAKALEQNLIDQYDILFLEGSDGKPKVGWIDKNNRPVLVQDEDEVKVVESLPATGEEGKIYLYNNEAYLWDGSKFAAISKSADLTALEEEVAKKVDEDTVDEKIAVALEGVGGNEVVEF